MKTIKARNGCDGTPMTVTVEALSAEYRKVTRTHGCAMLGVDNWIVALTPARARALAAALLKAAEGDR